MSTPQNTDNVVAMTTQPAAAPAARPETQRYSAFVPVLLFGLAVLAVLGWQAWLLSSERDALSTTHVNQQQTVTTPASCAHRSTAWRPTRGAWPTPGIRTPRCWCPS